jgi:hypothetical protein
MKRRAVRLLQRHCRTTTRSSGSETLDKRNAWGVRLMGTDLLTVRIDLDPSTAC